VTPRAQLPSVSLDRRSFEPLYHQLQELLKQHIESSRWQPGDLLPSEPELCRHFGVSRIVVRQALAMLEDERRVVRQRGRGTFVASPAFEQRAGGLVRLLQPPRQARLVIHVLENSLHDVDEAVRERLGISGRALRIATRLSSGGTPIAIIYSFFDPDRVAWLQAVPTAGLIAPDVSLSETGHRLGRSDLSVDTRECSTLEAEWLEIPERPPVFSVAIEEFEQHQETGTPLEVVQALFRGDLLACRLEFTSVPFTEMTATFAIADPARDD